MNKDRNELRDAEEARRFVLQGLWLQRVLPPRPATVRAVLEWALEIVSMGLELPPTGFLADLGHLALGQDNESTARDFPLLPGIPASLLRPYEDRVLGKLYADRLFDRAGDALRRYRGRDRARGLAFLVRCFVERSGFRGVGVSPGAIKSLLDVSSENAHVRGGELLANDGPQVLLLPQYESLIAATRQVAEIVAPEDVSQLERGSALRPEGEQLAERQVLRATRLLESALPRLRLRPSGGHQNVPTHLLDEDTYPVGGFSSLSTRGSIESLLHSQLAYIEDDERPDLFDVKFLRDELLYYSRDENQFLRRRHTFAFFLYPDLELTRFKDAELDFQRGVLLLALLCALVRKLIEWLSHDALTFHFVFVVPDGSDPLRPERDLLASLLSTEIENGTVQLTNEPEDRLAARCEQWARRSLCFALLVDVQPRELRSLDVPVLHVQINGPQPELTDTNGERVVMESDEPLDGWRQALHEILRQWL